MKTTSLSKHQYCMLSTGTSLLASEASDMHRDSAGPSLNNWKYKSRIKSKILPLFKHRQQISSRGKSVKISSFLSSPPFVQFSAKPITDHVITCHSLLLLENMREKCTKHDSQWLSATILKEVQMNPLGRKIMLRI